MCDYENIIKGEGELNQIFFCYKFEFEFFFLSLGERTRSDF